MSKIPVGVLGATGMVGQRFIQSLEDHPWFEIDALTASEESAGKRYEDAAKWNLYPPMPDSVKDIEVQSTDVESVENAELVFSALPSGIAEEVEPEMAKAGNMVASNASSYRMEDDVPLMIPEINADHLNMIETQRDNRGWDGAIVTNPNCTTIILLLSLQPVMENVGISEAFVTTMQAISGAGYSGVKGMEIVDNLVPHISKEEWKTENEPLKILGDYEDGQIKKADIGVSASCNRIPTLDGHTESVFMDLEENKTPEEIAELMKNFESEPQKRGLPTAPDQPIIVKEEKDQPQPRTARHAGSVPGMSVVVGRLRDDPTLDKGIRFTVSGNNAMRGAAGASVINAELMKDMDLI